MNELLRNAMVIASEEDKVTEALNLDVTFGVEAMEDGYTEAALRIELADLQTAYAAGSTAFDIIVDCEARLKALDANDEALDEKREAINQDLGSALDTFGLEAKDEGIIDKVLKVLDKIVDKIVMTYKKLFNVNSKNAAKLEKLLSKTISDGLPGKDSDGKIKASSGMVANFDTFNEYNLHVKNTHEFFEVLGVKLSEYQITSNLTIIDGFDDLRSEKSLDEIAQDQFLVLGKHFRDAFVLVKGTNTNEKQFATKTFTTGSYFKFDKEPTTKTFPVITLQKDENLKQTDTVEEVTVGDVIEAMKLYRDITKRVPAISDILLSTDKQYKSVRVEAKSKALLVTGDNQSDVNTYINQRIKGIMFAHFKALDQLLTQVIKVGVSTLAASIKVAKEDDK